MRKNNSPLWLYRLQHYVQRRYTEHIIRPQFDEAGVGLMVSKPRSLNIFGREIYVRKHLHIISSSQKPVQISTWSSKQQQGRIVIGNYVLISPGVQITSAEHISIGDNCMIASEAAISDSDWHGLYNRTRPFRCSAPVTIGDNVWVGQRAIIGKGVKIGKNSVIAAGAVVVNDVEANSVVGGNPAKFIKQLDPNRRMITREFLFTQTKDYDTNQHVLTEYLIHHNTTLNWLRTKFFPTKHD